MDNEILYKLYHFMLHEMNDNIEFFFDKYSNEFNQSFEDFKTKGETLKQHSIYKKYESMIEHDLEEFSKQENYDTIEDLYLDIKNIIESEKNIDDYDADIKDDNILIRLFEPTANDILDTILNLSSYTSFSTIMRHKAFSMNNEYSNDEDDSSYNEDDFDDSDDDSDEESNVEDDYSDESSQESIDEEKEDPIHCIESNEHHKCKKRENNDLPDIENRLKINNFID